MPLCWGLAAADGSARPAEEAGAALPAVLAHHGVRVLSDTQRQVEFARQAVKNVVAMHQATVHQFGVAIAGVEHSGRIGEFHRLRHLQVGVAATGKHAHRQHVRIVIAVIRGAGEIKVQLGRVDVAQRGNHGLLLGFGFGLFGGACLCGLLLHVDDQLLRVVVADQWHIVVRITFQGHVVDPSGIGGHDQIGDQPGLRRLDDHNGSLPGIRGLHQPAHRVADAQAGDVLAGQQVDDADMQRGAGDGGATLAVGVHHLPVRTDDVIGDAGLQPLLCGGVGRPVRQRHGRGLVHQFMTGAPVVGRADRDRPVDDAKTLEFMADAPVVRRRPASKGRGKERGRQGDGKKSAFHGGFSGGWNRGGSGHALRPVQGLNENAQRVVEHDLRLVGQLGVHADGDLRFPVRRRAVLPGDGFDFRPVHLVGVGARRQHAVDLRVDGVGRTERAVGLEPVADRAGGIAGQHGVAAVEQRLLRGLVGQHHAGVDDPVGKLRFDDALSHARAVAGLGHCNRAAHLVDGNDKGLDLALRADVGHTRYGDGRHGKCGNGGDAPGLGAGDLVAVALVPLAAGIEVRVGLSHVGFSFKDGNCLSGYTQGRHGVRTRGGFPRRAADRGRQSSRVLMSGEGCAQSDARPCFVAAALSCAR